MKDKAQEIFNIICRNWQGDTMIFPYSTENRRYKNVLLNRKDILKVIEDAVKEAEL